MRRAKITRGEVGMSADVPKPVLKRLSGMAGAMRGDWHGLASNVFTVDAFGAAAGMVCWQWPA